MSLEDTKVEDFELFSQLQDRAREISDGHVAILRFTTNWRIGFGTPAERDQIDHYCEGKTFREAALNALENGTAWPS